MTAGMTIEYHKDRLAKYENYRLRISVYGQFGLPVVRVISEDFFHYLVPESMLPIVRVKDLVPDFFPRAFGKRPFANSPHKSLVHSKLMTKLNLAFHKNGGGRLIYRGDDRKAGGGESRNDCNHETDDPETLIVVQHTGNNDPNLSPDHFKPIGKWLWKRERAFACFWKNEDGSWHCLPALLFCNTVPQTHP